MEEEKEEEWIRIIAAISQTQKNVTAVLKAKCEKDHTYSRANEKTDSSEEHGIILHFLLGLGRKGWLVQK